MQPKRVTARDVADYVGCSVSAVSLVVNGRYHGRVNDQRRDEIVAAIALLNYRPNTSASNLAKRSPSNVAFVCPDIRNPFFGDLFSGIVEALDGVYGVSLHISPGGSDYDINTVDEAQSGNIGGLILANPAQEVLSAFQPTSPTILVDSPEHSSDYVCVDLDLEGAANQLAAHLLSLGHTRIGYVDLARSKETFRRRKESLRQALSAGNATIVATTSVSEITLGSGGAAFAEVWPEWQRMGITAVVCADDVIAYGVLSQAQNTNIAIPGTVSLASFNDLAFSAILNPGLTSVHFAAIEMGRSAGTKLLELIRGGNPTSAVLDTTLSVRTSTAFAPTPG